MRRIAPAILALAALPLLAFGPARTQAPSHWTVIIGISDYINFTDEEGGDLPGAENDARGMRDVLVSKYNIPSDNILMLLNHDATRAGIEAARRIEDEEMMKQAGSPENIEAVTAFPVT